jgi:hypothetical protein
MHPRLLATPGAIALAVIALALASGTAAAKGHHRPITLSVRGQLEHVQGVDNAPAGPSAGDMLVFTEALFNGHGKRIGSDAATCVRLFDTASLCTGTYLLPGGQVMVQLLQPGPTGTYDQAVTGGTGRFAGASGTVRVKQQGGGDRFNFRLRRD